MNSRTTIWSLLICECLCIIFFTYSPLWDLFTFPINILSIFGAADSLCGEADLGALAVVVDGGASDRWVVTGVDVVAD